MTIDFSAECGGKGAVFEVCDTQLGGDRESGRDRQSQVGHLGEAGAFATEDIAHSGGTVGAAVAEEIDVSFDGHTVNWRRYSYTAIVTCKGTACRAFCVSSGTSVGYSPEKHAWQNVVASPPAARFIPSSDRYPSVSTPRCRRISSREWLEAINSDLVGVSMP